MHYLRKDRTDYLPRTLMKTILTLMASAIFYGVVCWGSSISTADMKRLNRLVKANSVLQCTLDPVEVVG